MKYSFTGASISPDVKTFSVAYFNNTSTLIQPTLSDYFTEALREKFISETNLRMIDSVGDLSYEGEIVGYSQTHAAVQADEVAAKNKLTITVRVKFTNVKDPQKNFDTKFSRFAQFDSDQSLTEVEENLIKEITEELIDDIYIKSVADW